MTDLTALTIAEIEAGLARREFSALELTDAYLKAIEAANRSLNAYIVVTADKARAMANAAESGSDGKGGAPRHAARHQGSVLRPRSACAGGQPYPRRLQAAL